MALSLSLRQTPFGINAAKGLMAAVRCSSVKSLHTSVKLCEKREWVGLIDDQKFENKNKNLNRPLSAHLTIYRWNVPMTLSITNRITGVIGVGIMTGSALLFGAQAFGFEQFPHYLEMMKDAPPAVIQGGKFALAFPLVFHSVNGLRHLTWDTGNMLSIGQVESTGYVVSAASVALTCGLVAM